MKALNRRDLCMALSAFAAMDGMAAGGQTQALPGETVLAKSRTFPFEQLQVKESANGGESRAVVRGVLPTGEPVEVHETTLQPGQMPHAPHKHRHSEFIMIREGTIEFDNDGTKTRVGPGGLNFNASNVMHGMKNVGETPAQYFVVAIGHESGKTLV